MSNQTKQQLWRFFRLVAMAAAGAAISEGLLTGTFATMLPVVVPALLEVIYRWIFPTAPVVVTELKPPTTWEEPWQV